MRLYKLLPTALLSSAVFLSGCMIGPNYQRPTIDMPKSYIEPAPIDATFANLPWWDLFTDETLKELITEALTNNRDLRVALSRIRESEYILGITRANQYPFISIEASGGRTSPSDNVIPGASSEESYFLGGAASFEIDLWGKLRRGTEASRAELLSTEASARNVTISLISSVASSYFLLLDVDDRLSIAKRTLKTREESLAIIQARFDKGTVPELDVNQAEIEVADAQALVAVFDRIVRQTENVLSVLVGSHPRLITRGQTLKKQLPLEIPAGLPMELLERRPDISAAEQQLAAETARIGVARANRLPSIVLTGSLGYASTDFDNLVGSNSATNNFLGSIFAPIFNSGQLKSQEQAQRERAEQARFNYEQAILDALRDVDDSLSSVRTYRAEHAARLRQLEAARNAAKLSRARYDGGIVSYLEVLDSERSFFQTELLESQARQNTYNAIISLYRALGGGWPAAQEVAEK